LLEDSLPDVIIIETQSGKRGVWLLALWIS